MRRLRLLFASLVIFLLNCNAPEAGAAELDFAPVKKWIAKQEDFRSVSADFIQTRALRALKDPLASPGRIWYIAPGTFRWELGTPAKTVVVKNGDVTYIIQPSKKRAERSVASAAPNAKPGVAAMSMMSFPQLKDFADYQRQFETLAIRTEGPKCFLEVLPRDALARKYLSALKLEFNTVTGQLLAFELATRDGSRLRNDFTNVQINSKIDRALFDYDLTGYEVKDAKN